MGFLSLTIFFLSIKNDFRISYFHAIHRLTCNRYFLSGETLGYPCENAFGFVANRVALKTCVEEDDIHCESTYNEIIHGHGISK